MPSSNVNTGKTGQGNAGFFDSAWVVILCGVSAALHVAKLVPALPVLRDAFGFGLVSAGFLLAAMQIVSMSIGVLIGLLADGIGPRKSMLIGLGLLCAASALGAVSGSVLALLLIRVVEGIGLLLACTPAPNLIRQIVAPARLDRMLGIWSAYIPFAFALALLLGPGLIVLAGWQALWWLTSAVSGLAALCLWRFVAADRAEPAAGLASSELSMPVARKTPDWRSRLRNTLSSPGPWLVALCFGVYSSQWISVIGFLPIVYQQAGIGLGATALLTALASLVNMFGNIAAGAWLSRGIKPTTLLALGYCTMALAALVAFTEWPIWLGVQAPPMARYAAVLLFSGVGGIVPGTLFALAVVFAPGPGTVSTTVGWMQQGSAIGQFVGPPLVAWVAAQAGGWGWTWVATGSFSLLGLLLTLRVAQQIRQSQADRLV